MLLLRTLGLGDDATEENSLERQKPEQRETPGRRKGIVNVEKARQLGMFPNGHRSSERGRD